jgi:diguanylate cyclase (GGDEF)-like protein/PAS domain S-box-containing protein
MEPTTPAKIQTENAELRQKLQEAEEILHAILQGQVDALIAMGPEGERVYALKGAERPYRMLVEEMTEAAVTLAPEGIILYCNPRFAQMLGLPVEQLSGQSILRFVDVEDKAAFEQLLGQSQRGRAQAEIRLVNGAYERVTVQVSAQAWSFDEIKVNSMIMMDVTDRRRTEEQLAYQARLLENVHDAIFATDERHRITFWNQAAQRMYGWTAKEAIGVQVHRLLRVQLTDEQRAEFRRLIAEAGRMQNLVIQHRRDGAALDVEEITIPLKDPAGRITGYVSVNRDVTDRNRAVSALQESETRYRLLFEDNVAGVFRSVLDTRTLESQRIECNRAYARIFGYASEEEMRDVPVLSLFPSETEWRAYAERIIAERVLSNYEVRMKHRDGRLIWVLLNGRARENHYPDSLLVEGTLVDITEQKMAAEALRVSEKRFHLAVDNFPGIFVIYDAQRRIQFMNMPGIIMTGRAEAEIIGHADEELYSPQVTAAYLPSLITAAETGTVQSVEARLNLPAGSFNSKVTYVPLLDDLGKPHQILGIAEDISERKQAEQALAEQAELLNLTHDAVFVRDLNGVIRFWNRGAEELYGWSREEAVGESTSALLQTGLPQPIEEIMAALLRDGHWEGELVHTRRDGSRIVVSSRWALQRDGERNAIAILQIGNDITKRKRAEEALRMSEERFRKIFDESPIGVGLSAVDGGWVHINPAFCRMLGYSQEELKAKTCRDVAFSEDAHADTAMAEQLFCGELPGYDLEQRFVTKNGRVIWAHVTATLIRNEADKTLHRMLMVEDITERKQALDKVRQLNAELEARVVARTSEWESANQALLNEIEEHARAEEALRASEARFRLLAENAQDLIYRIRLTPEWRYEYVSPSVSRVLGYAPEDFYADSDLAYKLVHPDERPLLQAIHRGEIASDATVVLRWTRKDGTPVWLEQRNVPVYDEGNNLIAIEGISRDVTERKRAEEALQLANQNLMSWASQLEQRNREISFLNEMGDLLQSCITVEETFRVIENSAQKLFPGDMGALYLMNDSKNMIEAMVTFGELAENAIEHVFVPDHCWALRRGRTHAVQDTCNGLVCQHVNGKPKEGAPCLGYICVPMVAQGETLGILYLQTFPGDQLTESKQRLAVSVAEHVALAISSLRLRETLRSQAIRDPLTGLFNRRYMEESLERELRRAARKHTPIAVVMLDLDNFKHFNDTFGHEAGDAILRAFGEFLGEHIREGDIACRYGGEEFTLILPEATLEETRVRMEQVRNGFKQLNTQSNGKSFGHLSVSLGIAIFPEHGLTSETLLRAADTALYRAKSQGRDRVDIAKNPL